MADRVSITFGPYLTGGVPAGVPLWREPAPGRAGELGGAGEMGGADGADEPKPATKGVRPSGDAG